MGMKFFIDLYYSCRTYNWKTKMKLMCVSSVHVLSEPGVLYVSSGMLSMSSRKMTDDA